MIHSATSNNLKRLSVCFAAMALLLAITSAAMGQDDSTAPTKYQMPSKAIAGVDP